MNVVISNYDSLHNPYYGGGGAIAIHEVAKRLKRKHKVTIVYGKHPHSKNHTIDGVTYKHIGLSFLGPKFSQLMFLAILPIYVKIMHYDIWIESFTPPISTALLPIFTKKPVIGLAHSLDGIDKSKEYNLPFHHIESFGLKRYKHFIVLTESVKEKIRQIHPKSTISIIPNGVKMALKNPRIRAQHILFIGRIEMNHKGLDLLMEAYKKISHKTELPLIIAGTGTNTNIQQLKDVIKKLNLQKKVKLVGKVTGKKKDKLFRNAAFVVLPSRYDNQPLTAMEAMSYGKPLVTYALEGLRWIPKECAIKAHPLNVDDYAVAMLKLIKNPLLRRRMSAYSTKFAAKFDWDTLAERYSKLINKISKDASFT
ncbi:MAG: glycosyltransferase family 4 protein [Candidatus Levybacteria bacterium]|nr:glycosyltransferase family 4 protein [Candidatus Levybacteria bacterium]